jgi:hypothetical protein
MLVTRILINKTLSHVSLSNWPLFQGKMVILKWNSLITLENRIQGMFWSGQIWHFFQGELSFCIVFYKFETDKTTYPWGSVYWVLIFHLAQKYLIIAPFGGSFGPRIGGDGGKGLGICRLWTSVPCDITCNSIKW